MISRFKNFKSPLISNSVLIGLRVLLAGSLAFFLSQAKLEWAEFYLLDLRARITPLPTPSDHVVLSLIDSSTVEDFRGFPKATDLKNFLERASTHQPRFIIFNLNPSDIEGTVEEKKAFAEVAAKTPGFFFTSDELALKGDTESLRLPAPFEMAPASSAPKTADTKIFGKDGVTRRMLYSFQDQPLLHTQVAGSYNPLIKDKQNVQGLFEFAGSQQIFIRFHSTGTLQRIPFTAVAQGKVVHDNLADKVLIVGSDLSKSSQEYILTPLSRDIKAMTQAEMHGSMIETLIQNNGIQQTSRWINALFIFLISLLTIHVVLAMTPARGLLVLIGTFTGFTVFSEFLFWSHDLWLQMAAPLLAIFISYYFFIPYRLIVENRRSWEYQQKNKLLRQVEELKTNFISMMSHDLKTPIARIQGMADIILRDDVKLSSSQVEAVDTIKQSSDDLLKFINAILAYGRIEAESVHLHLQARDINKLVEEVIKKHDFLARVKRIQVLSELEPMFPIQVDPDLIRQVLSNLIENAIKYSPDDTKILVSSEEIDGKVLIQVSDQGAGISAEELPHLFMKFYRCKNAKTSPIKGSGLGLYLAKYFVELHNGRISVESQVGKGSTFSIELPITLEVNNA